MDVQLNNSNVKSVIELRNKFQKNNIILFYEGAFSQDLIKSVLRFAEHKLEQTTVQASVKKKVFNVMVECLQNICKHSDKNVMFDTKSMFIIANKKEDYVITTGNPVKKDKINGLTESLNRINELDQIKMKEVFKSLLKEVKGTDKSISGLGLIDIARKSRGKINFKFKELDDNFSFFILQIKINNN